jgi:hypothetical protein
MESQIRWSSFSSKSNWQLRSIPDVDASSVGAHLAVYSPASGLNTTSQTAMTIKEGTTSMSKFCPAVKKVGTGLTQHRF